MLNTYRITFSYKSERADDTAMVQARSSSDALRRLLTFWDQPAEIYGIKIYKDDIFSFLAEKDWEDYQNMSGTHETHKDAR